MLGLDHRHWIEAHSCALCADKVTLQGTARFKDVSITQTERDFEIVAELRVEFSTPLSCQQIDIIRGGVGIGLIDSKGDLVINDVQRLQCLARCCLQWCHQGAFLDQRFEPATVLRKREGGGMRLLCVLTCPLVCQQGPEASSLLAY